MITKTNGVFTIKCWCFPGFKVSKFERNRCSVFKTFGRMIPLIFVRNKISVVNFH